MNWVAPEFAAYPLGAQYTHWIYSDPQSNVAYWDQPEKWPHAGYIAFQDREIVTTLTPQQLSQSVQFNLTGGKNCVVFARYLASTLVRGSSTQKLPTQLPAYINYSQRLDEGYFETQETSLINVFGYGWSPHTWPAPITWNDKLRRTFSLSSTGSVVTQDVTITLGWKVAYLNTGA